MAKTEPPKIPRFVILFWTIHSPTPNTEYVGTEDGLAQQLKELRESNDVTAIAVYSFFNAQQRTVRFQTFSPQP
jgi:hypothetical protein